MYKKTSKKIGRPLMDPEGAKGTRLILRLSATEKAQYESWASISGKSLSAWIRETLNKGRL
jgi:predicted HicB family RNase H-like nuclease